MFTLYFLNSREKTFFDCTRGFGVVVCVLFAVAELVAEATMFDFCTFVVILKSLVSLEGSYGCSKGHILFQCRT
jgi:hypothetical protein